MRKLLAVLAAVGLTAVLVMPSAAQKVSLGVKGGLNFADLHGADAEDIEAKTYLRGIGGAFAVFDITRTVAIQPELLYAQKGAKALFEGVNVKMKMDYIELPVLLRMSVPIAYSRFVPSVFIGPTIAYNVGCKVKGSDSDASVSLDCADADVQLRDWDYSAVFGAGADIKVGSAVIVLDGRYSYGLRAIDASGDDRDTRNTGISVMIGAKLNLTPSRLAILR